MKVLTVESRSEGSKIQVRDDSDTVIEAWTPQTVEQVKAWNGTVPDGWELRKSKKGNMVLVEKQQRGGGGGGWRNTKEAWELEQANWDRKNALDEQRRRERQAIEQESIHRSVALERAIEAFAVPVPGLPLSANPTARSVVLPLADEFYAWLRSSPAPGGQEATNVAQGPAQAVPGPSQTSPAEPKPERQALERAGGARQAGDTSSPSSGEAAAASAEPGEGSGKVPSLGSIRFPYTPENCDQGAGAHKLVSGNWVPTVQIDGMAHCKRCGMKTVLYRESDVGP